MPALPGHIWSAWRKGFHVVPFDHPIYSRASSTYVHRRPSHHTNIISQPHFFSLVYFAGMQAGQLQPPILPQCVAKQSQWPPEWAVLQAGQPGVRVPKQYCGIRPRAPLAQPQGPNWWNGMLANLDYVLEWCSPILTWHELRDGDGLAGNPSHPNLHTDCCCLDISCRAWMRSQHVFKLQPHGKHAKSSTSLSRGYLKVKLGGFHDNTVEFYLHYIICYAYYGPPPFKEAVVGHLCHHKLCLLPWHMIWMEQGANVQMAWDHARQLDYA